MRTSVTVKLDGVDGGGDGAPSVAATLLLGLLVAEGLALGEPQDIVGLLAPVAVSAHLTDNKQVCQLCKPRVNLASQQEVTVWSLNV